jgi:hypothetical protein
MAMHLGGSRTQLWQGSKTDQQWIRGHFAGVCGD